MTFEWKLGIFLLIIYVGVPLLKFFLSCLITAIQIFSHPFKHYKGKVWNKWE